MSRITIKQERFCQKYIETGNASEAYRLSYDAGDMKPNTIHRSAKELLDDHRISARIEQMQAEHRLRHAVSVDSLTRELNQAREAALKARNASAMIAATMGKAKLHGLLVHRNEVSLKRPEDMTEAELRTVLGNDFDSGISNDP